MIAVSIILFIAGGVLGYVLSQLSAARKLQVVSLETERLKVELAMLQQQKSESAQQLQAQQTKLDSVMAELTPTSETLYVLHKLITSSVESVSVSISLR